MPYRACFLNVTFLLSFCTLLIRIADTKVSIRNPGGTTTLTAKCQVAAQIPREPPDASAPCSTWLAEVQGTPTVTFLGKL